MRCTSPRTVGFKSDGKTISWSQKDYSKEFATFQLPCGKCLACRLDYSRQWAVRCMHEAKCFGDRNSFITLTYNDENLYSDKLYYIDFQLFIKRLRSRILDDELKKIFPSHSSDQRADEWSGMSKESKKEINEKIAIGFFVTGEYGERRKRKHWHALIFNWRPDDCEYKYSNDRGDKVYSSKQLDDLWTFGITEVGSVTFESAGYCARYAAKKLVHGKDQDHNYDPISKKSSKHAIGKRWLEKYHDDLFNYGQLIVNGRPAGSIPRYYEKWLAKHHPEKFVRYIIEVKSKKQLEAQERAIKDQATRPYSNSKALAEAIILYENVKNRLFKFVKF